MSGTWAIAQVESLSGAPAKSLLDRITIDTEIGHGKPCVRNMRFIAGKPTRVVRVTLGNRSNDQLISLFACHCPDL